MAKPYTTPEAVMTGPPRVTPLKPTPYWSSLVPGVMAESVGQAKIVSEMARMRECQRRIDMLENDWKDLLLAKILQRYKSKRIRDTAADLITTEHNPLRRIVELVATLYKWGPIRELRDAKANGIAHALWNEMLIDEFMALANRRWVALGDAILFPIVDAPFLTDGRMRPWLWTGENTSILQHPGDPSRCVAAWHEEALCNTPGVIQIRHYYVDAERWVVTDQHKQVIAEIEHGLGRFPGVVVHAEHRTGGWFWGDDAMSPVVESSLSVGIDMFRLERILHFQSELQPTYQGHAREIAKGIGIGAEHLWAGPGIWGKLDLQASPEHVLSVINRRLSWIAGQFDIDAELYFNTVKETSGFALRLKRASLDARRVADWKVARRVEKELLVLMALVSERFHPSLKLDSMKAEFSTLDFREEPELESPTERNRNWAERRKLGILSRVEILRELNPDLSREQALERAKQVAIDEAEVDKIRIEHNLSEEPGTANKTPEENGRDGARAKRDENDNPDEGDLDTEAADALAQIRGKR